MPAIANDPRLPSYRRPDVDDAAKDLALVADLLAGTRQMHARSSTYIKKWADEEQGIYDIRRTCETVFGGLERTLSAAVGMLFATPPQIEWNAAEALMSPHWDNIDAAGTKGSVFIKRYAEACIRDGLGALLVDHTPVPLDPTTNKPVLVTGANERQLGLRPTWAAYGRAQIINWRTAVINGQRKLTLIVFHEVQDVIDGAFGIRSVHRFRVLSLAGGQASWTLYEQAKDDAREPEHFTVVGQGTFKNKSGQVADFLPVSVGYCGRTDSPLTATIPLLGVAWANLAHWQQSTDLRFYRMLAAYPQPTVIGQLAPDPSTGSTGTLRLGPGVAVHLTTDGQAQASFAWTEIAGTSMVQLASGIDEKLGQMAKQGAAFLQTDTRAPETAEAKRMDGVAENSNLATAGQGIEDAVNAALEYHAWYLGIDKPNAPVLTISTDFESTVMDPATMQAYGDLHQKAGLPIRIILEQLQAGGRIGPDEDLDALEAEMAAEEAAKAQADAQAAQDQLAMQDTAPRAFSVDFGGGRTAKINAA